MAWKKLVLAIVWSVALLVWLGVVGVYLSEPTTREWTIAIAAAALATEIAFWLTAALMGLSLWESRKSVMRFLTRPFRRS